MITKALLILKSWSPDVNSKYVMLVFDEKEISALENVFPGTLVFPRTVMAKMDVKSRSWCQYIR